MTKDLTKRFLMVMKFAMPLLYLVMGLMLLLTDVFGTGAGKFRPALGILLIGYSVFRSWRIIADPTNRKENETESE